MLGQDVQLGRPRNEDVGSGSTTLPAHVSRFTTRHADEHKAWVSARYIDHERHVRAHAEGFEFLAEFSELGSITTARTRYLAAAVRTSWPSLPFLTVGHLHSGKYLLRWQGGEVRLTHRATMLVPPYGGTQLHDCAHASAITLSMDTLLRVAEETSGLDRGRVRFTRPLPISPAAEHQWLGTARYIQRGIYNRDLAQPLILVAAEQMIAASVLATFPNTTMTAEVRTPRDPATAASVRRAIAFIDAHASLPITLTDIATAVGLAPRTLQYAFRRHRDTTPLAYLRRVRLALAHAELVAAQPGDTTTMATVAARWGYASVNRFAAAYRGVYGQPPAQTLHT